MKSKNSLRKRKVMNTKNNRKAGEEAVVSSL